MSKQKTSISTTQLKQLCPASKHQSEAAACPPPALDTRDIFGDCRERLLNHRGDTYRLRVTAQGKLILTK